MTVSLTDLSVMVIDCQATGANPQRGSLLELGWMPARASGADPSRVSGVRSCLCGLPEGEKIPRAISRITGITEKSLEAGKNSETIWQQLMLDVETCIWLCSKLLIHGFGREFSDSISA